MSIKKTSYIFRCLQLVHVFNQFNKEMYFNNYNTLPVAVYSQLYFSSKIKIVFERVFPFHVYFI